MMEFEAVSEEGINFKYVSEMKGDGSCKFTAVDWHSVSLTIKAEEMDDVTQPLVETALRTEIERLMRQ